MISDEQARARYTVIVVDVDAWKPRGIGKTLASALQCAREVAAHDEGVAHLPVGCDACGHGRDETAWRAYRLSPEAGEWIWGVGWDVDSMEDLRLTWDEERRCWDYHRLSDCPDCEGTGHIPPGLSMRPNRKKCTRCAGNGILPDAEQPSDWYRAPGREVKPIWQGERSGCAP